METSFCFDEIEPSDAGVIEYYQLMTDRSMFNRKYKEWKSQFRNKSEIERTKKECDRLPKRMRNILTEDEEDDDFSVCDMDDEPLVERDFEG